MACLPEAYEGLVSVPDWSLGGFFLFIYLFFFFEALNWASDQGRGLPSMPDEFSPLYKVSSTTISFFF